ncbi:MAG: hypothetical protein WAX66_02310 [Patescibacteria group bacterium]
MPQSAIQGAVVEIIPDHEAIGSVLNFEEIETEKGVTSQIQESIKKLEGTTLRRDSIGQAFGHNLVELLVYENKKLKEEPEKLREKTSIILQVGREYAKMQRENVNSFLNGFMAEACLALSLDELGYTVLAPTIEEDIKGKIDMFVIDKNYTQEPYALAIQVKNSSEVEDIIVHNLNDDIKNLNMQLETQSIRYLPEFKSKLAYSNKYMLEYLSKNKERFNGRVIPLVVIIPGGDMSETSSYNTVTSAPVKGFSYKLFDKLNEIYEGEKL